MIRIIKGRYGYTAEDNTVQIAEAGKELSLDKKEEERLISLGIAEALPQKDIPKEKKPAPAPRKRKGGKK